MQAEVVDADPSGDNATVKAGANQAHRTLEAVDFVCPEKYEVIGVIGSGGMGTVFKVRQKHLDKMMAIKLLLSEKGSEDAALRFQEEAKAASNLSHPNLLTFRDFGITECGCPYLVMDYIDGVDLARMLERAGKLDVNEVLEIFIQVFDGLAHAHERGVLHRDIKPANIMLSNEDKQTPVKIVDFGIAKARNSKQNLTKTGEVFGTPLYMSPEQGLGRKVDERSDIYSVGCVMYETLTGQPPFQGMSAIETIFMHQTAPVPPLSEANKTINYSGPLERVIARMLAKDPDQRPQSATEAKALLVALSPNAPKPAINPLALLTSFVNKPWRSGKKSTASPTVLSTIESIIIKVALITFAFLTIVSCVALLSK